MRRNEPFLGVVCACCIAINVVALPRRTFAEDGLRHRIALAAGFDTRVRPEPGGHGYGLIAYDIEGLPAGSRAHGSYNTDTVRLRYDQIHFGRGVFELGFQFAYEFSFAGLLPDYFRGGLLDPSRGFNAAYLEFGGLLKASLPRDHYLEIAFDVRRWMFQPNERTALALVVPPDQWVLSPRLRYVFWRIRDDPSLREPHRPFPRVHGATFGVELGLDHRIDPAPFGALDGESFEPIDPRNNGEETVLLFRQWLRAGYQANEYFRIQVAQFSGTGRGEDDLTRTRIGGMNPYSIPLAGAPWAAIIADLFVAAEISLHFRFFREMEFGLLFDGAAIRDLSRVGERDMGFVGGLGLFVDLRVRSFQVDVRGGWTPSLGYDRTGHFGVFASLGWQWQNR